MTTTFVPDWLSRSAAHYPERLAISSGAETCTYAELAQATAVQAVRLTAMGVRAGERVAVLAHSGSPFAVTVHALTWLGAILVPLNLRLTTAEMAWQASDAGATWLLYGPELVAVAEELAAGVPGATAVPMMGDDRRAHEQVMMPERRIDLAAPQAIIYTSGTTGRPKGAIITYGMHWWSAVGSMLNLGHDPDDRWLAVLPFFHIGGLAILMRAVMAGTGVVILDHFDPAAANEAIRTQQVTLASVVAVMLQRMLADLDARHVPLPTLRAVLLGGGPAPRPLLEDCARRGLPVLQTYGMTESCSQAVTLPPADALRKLGAAGLPLGSVEVAIWQDGQPIAAGVEGEIMLRGPTITPGYWGRPEATAAAFHDGWFATGDIGRLDDDGYLTVLDRRSDLIISGGENIYPAEVEAVLLAHPAVAEAGVCGLADAQWSQVPVAAVVLHAGQVATAADLITFVAERLAKYKVPRQVAIVAALPRNGAGKLLRRELPGLFGEIA